jgi:hypothetical protein
MLITDANMTRPSNDPVGQNFDWLISFRYIARSQLSFVNVTLSHFRRKSALILLDTESILFMSNVTAIDNERLYDDPLGYSPVGTVISSDEVRSQVIIERSTFSSNRLRASKLPQVSSFNVIAGGAIGVFGKLKISNSVFESNHVSLSYPLIIVKAVYTENCGGAVAAFGPSTLIENTKFTSNFVTDNGNFSYISTGGALCIGQNPHVHIIKSNFTLNVAGSGAGIGQYGRILQFASPTGLAQTVLVESSNFNNNICSVKGCGISLTPQEYANGMIFNLSDSNLSGNILRPSKCNQTIREMEFLATSFEGGAALSWVANPAASLLSFMSKPKIVIYNSSFASNQLTDSACGLEGGMALMIYRAGSIEISDTKFTQHHSPIASSVAWLMLFDSLEITNTTFYDNALSSAASNIFEIRRTSGLPATNQLTSSWRAKVSSSTTPTFRMTQLRIKAGVDHRKDEESSASFSPMQGSKQLVVPLQAGTCFFYRLQFLLSKAEGSLLHVSEVGRVHIKNVTSARDLNLASYFYNIQTAGEVVLEGVTTEAIGIPIYIAFVFREVWFNNCLFSRYNFREFISNRRAILATVIVYQAYTVYVDQSEWSSNIGITSLQLSSVKKAYILDSRFNNNFVTIADGAPLLLDHSETSIVKSEFLHNMGKKGGAVSTNSFLLVKDSVFYNNRATSAGGAIYTLESMEVQVSRCNFTKNKSHAEGGAIYFAHPDPSLYRSVTPRPNNIGKKNINAIRHNLSSRQDPHRPKPKLGSVFIPLAPTRARLDIHYCTFKDNYAVVGGAIALFSDVEAAISNSNLTRNLAQTSGGAVFMSTTTLSSSQSSFSRAVETTIEDLETENLELDIPPSLSINNCLLERNGAFRWDELYNRIPSPISLDKLTKRPSTNAAREEPTDSGSGGAVYVKQAALFIKQSEFMANECAFFGGAVYTCDAVKKAIQIYDSSFRGNTAYLAGGSLAVDETFSSKLGSTSGSCELRVQNSVFHDNSAGFGGSIFWAPFTNCSSKPRSNSATDVLHSEIHLDSTGSLLEEEIGMPPIISNTTLSYNWASVSGGAIYQASAARFSSINFDQLIFDSNTANVSGGTFFYNPPSVQEPRPDLSLPSFCTPPANCTIILLETNSNRSLPLWGALQASSAWRIRTSLPLIDFINAGNFPVGYYFYDLYDQVVLETPGLVPFKVLQDRNNILNNQGVILVQSTTEELITLRVATFNNSVISGLVMASPYDPRIPNPFTKPLKLGATVRLVGKTFNEDKSAYYDITVHLNVTALGCPVGEGLVRIPYSPGSISTSRSDPIPLMLYSCSPCLIGTYNFNGDGQCYSCSTTTGGPIPVNCERSRVTSLAGFWAEPVPESYVLRLKSSAKPFQDTVWETHGENISRTIAERPESPSGPSVAAVSNMFFVAKCPTGYCLAGGCSSGRQGVLCSACVDGSFETLFGACSESLCSKPNYLFLIVSFIAILVATLTFHHFLHYSPFPTMHIAFATLTGLLMLHPALEWSLPIGWPKLAALLCGFRANAMQRALIFTFVPYSSLAIIAVSTLIAKVVVFVSVRFRSTIADFFSFDRLLKTSSAILFTLFYPTLKTQFDWTLCQDTPFGILWVIAPSIECTAQSFKLARLASSLISVPLVGLPIVCGLLVVILHWIYGQERLRLSAWMHFLVNPRARSKAHAISIIDIVGRICLALVMSLAPPHSEVLYSATVAAVLLAFLVSQRYATLFLTALQRTTASISFALLTCLAAAQPALFASPTYPVVALIIFAIYLFALILGFSLGRSSSALEADIDVTKDSWTSSAMFSMEPREPSGEPGQMEDSSDSESSFSEDVPLLLS